jgi:hypothetical protein
MRTTKITAKRLRPLEPVSRAAKAIVALRGGSTNAERVRAITGLLREEAAAAPESDKTAQWVFYQTFEDDNKPNLHHFQGTCADVILHVLKEDLAWTDCESFCCDLVEQRHTMYDLFDEEKHTESSMCDIFMDAFWKGDGNGVSAGLSRFHPEVVPAAAADAPGGGDLTTAPWLDALVGKPVGEGAAVAAAVPVPEPRVGAASEEEEGVKKRACVEADTPTPAPVVDAAKAASCKEYLRGAVSSDVIQTMERYGVFSMFHMLEWEWRDVRGIFMNSNVSESDQRMVYSMAATFARQNRAKVDADRKAAAEAWYADSSAIRSEHAGAEVIVVKDEA